MKKSAIFNSLAIVLLAAACNNPNTQPKNTFQENPGIKKSNATANETDQPEPSTGDFAIQSNIQSQMARKGLGYLVEGQEIIVDAKGNTIVNYVAEFGVINGHVYIEGVVKTEQDKQIIGDMVKNTPGVKSFENLLIVKDPQSIPKVKR